MCLPTNNVICFALEQMQCDFAINKMSFTLNAPEIAMTWDKAQRKMSESNILASAMPPAKNSCWMISLRVTNS